MLPSSSCLSSVHSMQQGYVNKVNTQRRHIKPYCCCSKKLSINTPVFLGPLHTIGSSACFNRKAIDMTHRVFSLSRYTGTHLHSVHAVCPSLWCRYFQPRPTPYRGPCRNGYNITVSRLHKLRTLHRRRGWSVYQPQTSSVLMAHIDQCPAVQRGVPPPEAPRLTV